MMEVADVYVKPLGSDDAAHCRGREDGGSKKLRAPQRYITVSLEK